MKWQALHRWDVSAQEAVAIQRHLASQVSRSSTLPQQVRYVAGVDLSPPDREGLTQGAVVVLRYPELTIEEARVARERPGFPYIPGLLSFRETPVLLAALERLTLTPDLVLVDGQGLAHPRRFGIACHLGLLLECPTIGCAKSILRGTHPPLEPQRGAWAELVDRGEVVGAALRSREGVSPVYVSIGHRVDLASAVQWVLNCCRGYRLPEPTRLAHQAAAGQLPEREPRQQTRAAVPEQAKLF